MTAYIQMKRADAEKWLAALRSGEYAQCKDTMCNFLSDPIGYCCLGVLQMALDGKVEETDDGVARQTPSESWLERHGIFFLDQSLSSTENPHIEAIGVSAAEANDSGAYDFNELADLLAAEITYTD